MSIQITVQLEDIGSADLLTGYAAGALIRLQRDTTSAFPAASEVTTIPIVSGTESYQVWDSAGTSASWYRTRYENAGGTILSDWSAAFQVGTPAYLCSLTDVKRLVLSSVPTDTTANEDLLALIRQVSADIQYRTGKQFLPDTATTYTFDTRYGRVLEVPLGIRTLTTLEIASTDQPDTGGTYSTVTAADVLLRPLQREAGWPYTRVELATTSQFWTARNGAKLTGTFGWSTVPADIEGVAIRAVVRAWHAKSSGFNDVTGFSEMGRPVYSRNYSLDDKLTLDRYTEQVVR